MRNRSAKYTVIAGSEAVQPQKLGPEQQETLGGMDREFIRVFGGEVPEGLQRDAAQALRPRRNLDVAEPLDDLAVERSRRAAGKGMHLESPQPQDQRR